MLVEQERRRDGFSPEAAITMGDGQVWYLRKPRYSSRAVFKENGDADFATRVTFNADYEPLVAQHEAAEDNYERVKIAAKMVRLLLLANYDLTNEELGDLITLDESEANVQMWNALSSVVLGIAPKASSGGSDAA